MLRRLYINFGKRLLDLVIVIPSLIVLAPVLALVALLVRIKLGSPVLFRQQRPGRNGQPFTLLKFRTMTDDCDEQGNLLPDAERLTTFGQFLRKSSLDEFPEFLNVLHGEMSLVGPRPLLMKYLDFYTSEQMRRHEVLPGITGWAQINGRNTLTWDDRFNLDVWYIEHCSLMLDILILARTLKKVVQREGISAQDHATMPEFKGST